MDHINRPTLFATIGPLRAFRSIPLQLGRLMVVLHRLDPAPIVLDLATHGLCPSALAENVALDEIDTCLGAIAHPQHLALRDWLQCSRPAIDGPRVLCHGDLHALNVLGGADDAVVIDWELAILADPAYDVSRTKLLMHAAPLDLPPAVRPIIHRLGRGAARRFEAHYAANAPLDADSLRWHEVLHAARMFSLVVARGSGAACLPSDEVLDAWSPALRFLSLQMGRQTGIAIEWS